MWSPSIAVSGKYYNVYYHRRFPERLYLGIPFKFELSEVGTMCFLRTPMVLRSQDILLKHATKLQWKVPWGGHASQRFGLILMIILHLSAQRHLCNVQRSRARVSVLTLLFFFPLRFSNYSIIYPPYLPPFQPLQTVRPACLGSIVFPDSMPRQNRMNHAAQSPEGT